MRRLGTMVLGGLLICGCASSASNAPGKAVSGHNVRSRAAAGAVSTGEEKDSATVLADEIARHLDKLPHRRLTVAAFTDIAGDESEDGRLLAEQVTTRLSRIEGLMLVERRQLNQILEEQKLSLTGITVEEGRKIGQILNVDAVVSGTIADLSDYQEINARMIDVATGEIHCAVSHRRDTPQYGRETARLPEAQRAALDRQRQERRTERIRHPELHRLKESHRRDLLRLKRKNPHKYSQVVRTLQTVEGIRRRDSAVFLRLTEPRRSAHSRHLRSLSSEQRKQIKALRRDIGAAIRATPTYKDVLLYQRKQILGTGRK